VHVARVGGEQVDRALAGRPDEADLRFEHGRRRAHARQRLHFAERPFVEARSRTCLQLVARLADHPVGQLRHRPAEACGRDLRGEQQPDPDGDAEHREQLLHEHAARAQAHHIEAGDIVEAHRGGAPAAAEGTVRARRGRVRLPPWTGRDGQRGVRVELGEPPVAQHVHTVGVRRRLRVVRDEQQRGPALAADLAE
jgi:hypothetical protein